MSLNKPAWGAGKERALAALDALLRGISIYLLPAVVGLATLLALFVWDDQLPADGATALQIKSVEDKGHRLAPAQALARLSAEPLASYRETRLSEQPFWIYFETRPRPNENVLVELPSRHATRIGCWNAANLQPLGSADRLSATGAVRPAKAGFVLDLGGASGIVPLLCEVQFIGPARITAAQWAVSQFEFSANDFYRKSGLLDGGVLLLAFFVLMIAAVNRAAIYVLFAVWLVFNLRMGAISAGWDMQWLGSVVPVSWLPQSRLLTFAAFYTLTGMLFRQMFREELARLNYAGTMRWVHAVCLLLLPVALLASYEIALPVMWIAGGASIAVLFYLLAQILRRADSKVAFWYGLSLSITLAATFYEVLAAAVGVKNMIGSINSVTAALSSTLMAAFAIAEQIRLERKQRVQAETELRVTYEMIPVGLFTLDARGCFVSINPALQKMLGMDGQSLSKRPWGDYFEPGAWLRMQNVMLDTQGGEIEIDGVESGGARKRYLVKAALAGERIEGSLQDITEKSKALERLHYLAENDPLTGVLNRRGVERRLENAMSALKNGGTPLAVAYLDLDRFKLVNDLYGHAAGDEVLCQVCTRVKELLTPGQEIGRIGGDEFIILFQGAPIRAAAWTCRGIISGLADAPFLVGERAFQLSGSIGLVEAEPGALVKDVIAAADQGCRESKRTGESSLVVYERSSSVFRAREEDLRLIERIRCEGGPQGLFLEMQPLLSTRDPFGTLDFEVLLRMRDADGGLIEAGRIIPLAEDKGCVGIIDRWVLSTTLAWLNLHGEHLPATRFVCMNLSGASLNDEHFLADALALMKRYPQSARRLCVEITESVALHDLANMNRFIDAVREVGAKVALDDFGAGYTSFSYLKDLPADVLKIDGAFIRSVNGHPANLAIVEAIVTLARSLGMKTIAEWAEDHETVRTLVELGIDFIQGYVVARPQSPEQILAGESAGAFVQDEHLRQYLHSIANREPEMPLWEDYAPVNPGDLH